MSRPNHVPVVGCLVFVCWAAGQKEIMVPGERENGPDERKKTPRLPPRWFVRFVWSAHRALCRVSAGRLGLRRPKRGGWGMLRLATTGRRTGQERRVILGYIEDGPNLVTLAMNGWADGEPAWWLNLQAVPDATVDLAGGSRSVRARVAEGAERSRLWRRWCGVGQQVDAYAALRSSETAVVILEPRPPGS
jgi:deazaflavin-dependent oxidoreductase (nitroreductase family)